MRVIHPHPELFCAGAWTATRGEGMHADLTSCRSFEEIAAVQNVFVLLSQDSDIKACLLCRMTSLRWQFAFAGMGT